VLNLLEWRGGEVETRESAKLLCEGSIPFRASNFPNKKTVNVDGFLIFKSALIVVGMVLLPSSAKLADQKLHSSLQKKAQELGKYTKVYLERR
jgi:hypothetical protein